MNFSAMMEHLSECSLLEAMMALPATPDIELELPDRPLDGSADHIPDFLDETHLLRPTNFKSESAAFAQWTANPAPQSRRASGPKPG